MKNNGFIYFSPKRPIGIGTIPMRIKPVEIVNYDSRTGAVHPDDSEDLGYKAWGYVRYKEELTEKEVDDYELIPADKRKWFGVIVRQDVNDSDKVSISHYKTVVSGKKPENMETHGRTSDVYVVWCNKIEIAHKLINDREKAFDYICGIID